VDADELVRRFILREYRKRYVPVHHPPGDAMRHLVACPDLTVTEQEASNGLYGCDTGCEYARLEATMRCLHGFSDDYVYGEFGDLAGIIADLERDAELHR